MRPKSLRDLDSTELRDKRVLVRVDYQFVMPEQTPLPPRSFSQVTTRTAPSGTRTGSKRASRL